MSGPIVLCIIGFIIFGIGYTAMVNAFKKTGSDADDAIPPVLRILYVCTVIGGFVFIIGLIGILMQLEWPH